MNESKKILLIEDDDFITKAYKAGLENAGFAVDIALDGKEGLEKAKSPYDLILLDIIMPKVDGFEVLQRLEQGHPPVVILSNLGQETDVEKGTSLGAVDYLIKANHSMYEVIEKVKHHSA